MRNRLLFEMRNLRCQLLLQIRAFSCGKLLGNVALIARVFCEELSPNTCLLGNGLVRLGRVRVRRTNCVGNASYYVGWRIPGGSEPLTNR